MTDVKLTDVKLTDQLAGHENAGHKRAHSGERLNRLSIDLAFLLSSLSLLRYEITTGNHVCTVYYSVVGLKIAHFTVVCLSV